MRASVRSSARRRRGTGELCVPSFRLSSRRVDSRRVDNAPLPGPRACATLRARRVTGHSTTRGATVRPNKIKQMWRDGRFVTLGWLSVSHGFTAEVMARQGFDALCVDMQHGTTDMNDVWPMLPAISQTATVPVAGGPRHDPPTATNAR